MKKVIIIASIVALVCLAGLLLTSSSQNSLNIKHHLNKLDQILLSIHTSIHTQNDSEDAAKACLAKETGVCVESLKASLSGQTPEQLQNFRQTLQQQGQEFKTFMDDEANQNIAAMDNYINENFVHDPVTGVFWTCVEATLRTCNLVTLDQILLSVHTTLHAQSEDEAQECLKREGSVCGQAVKARLAGETVEVRLNWAATLKTQMEAFDTYMKDEANQNDAAMKSYMTANLVNDPVTGQFWTCVDNSLTTCNPDALDQILLSIHTKVHAEFDEETNQCLDREESVCTKNLKTRLAAKTPAQLQIWKSTFATQMQAFKTFINAEANQNAAAMKSYLTANLVNDPVTGILWTCLANSLTTCTNPATPTEEFQRRHQLKHEHHHHY